MQIKHFSNDVQALARAHRSDDSLMLQTPSGKLKENTLFERTIGRGKQLIAKISGESYKLEKISITQAKAVIQDRFNAQLRFFSGEKNFDEYDKTALKETGNKFLDAVLNSDIIFSNPKQAINSNIKLQLSDKQGDKSAEATAFQRLESVYSPKNSSARFTAEAREFDYLRGTNANAAVSEEQITDTYKLGAFAERAHKDGATKDQAYFIAKLALIPNAFPGSLDEKKKYDIAVSTFLHAYESGIRDFEKMEKILPLSIKKADAESKLRDLQENLKKTTTPDSSQNTAIKKTSSTDNIFYFSKEAKIDNRELTGFIHRATKDGADANYAIAIAMLTLDYFPNLPTDKEERYELAKTTLSFIDLDKLIKHEKSNSFGKLKEIYVLKYAEASAESELRKIRNDIHRIFFSK